MVIDVDKFVASLIKHYCEAYDIDRNFMRCWFDDTLEEQGLEYKDGEIVKTQRRIATEAKEAIFDDEDERIRRDIIRILKGELGYTSKEDANKYIAWLEKQGEQKVPINDFKARNWYVSKVDGKIHDLTYNPTDKKELKKLTQLVTKISEQVPSILDLKLMDCPLSVKTVNAVKVIINKPAKDVTLGDIIKCNKAELLALRNFGKVSLRELEDFLADYGLKLEGE